MLELNFEMVEPAGGDCCQFSTFISSGYILLRLNFLMRDCSQGCCYTHFIFFNTEQSTVPATFHNRRLRHFAKQFKSLIRPMKCSEKLTNSMKIGKHTSLTLLKVSVNILKVEIESEIQTSQENSFVE